jgi:hypothetical protein
MQMNNNNPSAMGIIRQFQEDKAVLMNMLDNISLIQSLAVEYNMSDAAADELGVLESLTKICSLNERLSVELGEIQMHRETLDKCLLEYLG